MRLGEILNEEGTKKFDSRPTAKSIQEFVSMAMQKQARIVQFNGVAYQTDLSDHHDVIEPKQLLSGKPVVISYDSAKGEGDRGSLNISFV